MSSFRGEGSSPGQPTRKASSHSKARDRCPAPLFLLPARVVSLGVLGRLALITPALFSRPPPRPSGRRGRGQLGFLAPSLSRMGGRERGGWGSEGSPRRGADNGADSRNVYGGRPLHRLGPQPPHP